MIHPRTISAAPLFFFLLLAPTETLAQREAAGVRVPEGFNISLFADDEMAHNIYSLTLDSRGRVVVSGPGYIRILIDADSDGKAESVKQFVDGPRSGAQGMFFDGRNLICSGGDGLQIYRDDDRDDKADGKPEVFLRMLAGGEHHVHSIQKGPDGWFYVIAGNYTGITENYISLPTSPVKKPYAGVLMRIRSDLSAGEIVCDGMRNAYDFAITQQGDFFTFDSDGERDVSLPWYRPTRVFHLLSMSNSGWVSRSWKRPNYFIDMPPVVASFGRASPTFVVPYRHDQFPQKYRNALFVADWTYGRVMALPLKPDGSVWSAGPIDFMTAVGDFGFAPTSAAVGPDGSLYVSIGGRGTRGGVYKITYGEPDAEESVAATDDEERLERVLKAKQPLSSWSRSSWMRDAERLEQKSFVTAAVDEERSDAERVRAIEVLTEMFDGVDNKTAEKLSKSRSAVVRARTAWAIGRKAPASPDVAALQPFADDKSALVRRFTMEALHTTDGANWDGIVSLVSENLASKDRFVRQAAARAASRIPTSKINGLYKRVSSSAPAIVAVGWAIADRSPKVVPSVLNMAASVLEPTNGRHHPVALRIECARLIQIALGDVGPAANRYAAYEGYAPTLDLTESADQLTSLRDRVTKVFPADDELLNRELARVIAMLEPTDPAVFDRLLKQISEDSDPVDDIHFLLAASRVKATRTETQSAASANALIALDAKIRQRSLKQDSNWTPRVAELYATLVQNDKSLPGTIAKLDQFGRPAHVAFLGLMKEDDLQVALNGFARQIEQAGDEYPWDNNVVFAMSRSKNAEHRKLIRQQLENPAVHDAALIVISRDPQEADRKRLVEALDTPDRSVLISAVTALTKLPAKTASPDETVRLVRTVRRLGGLPAEFQLRETAIRLLKQQSGKDFGFVLGEDGYRPQTDVLNKWSDWAANEYPKLNALLTGGSDDDLAALKKLTARADWDAGDAAKGQALYKRLKCSQCHGGQTALGPTLVGVTSRFSRADLFTAIVAPNKDVSTRYQTTQIQTEVGKVLTGLVIYRSVDGLLLRTSQNQTLRIEATDIEFSRALSTSLMPSGLLKEASPEDLANLYAYMKTLNSPADELPQPMAEPKTKKPVGKNGQPAGR